MVWSSDNVFLVSINRRFRPLHVRAVVGGTVLVAAVVVDHTVANLANLHTSLEFLHLFLPALSIISLVPHLDSPFYFVFAYFLTQGHSPFHSWTKLRRYRLLSCPAAVVRCVLPTMIPYAYRSMMI